MYTRGIDHLALVADDMPAAMDFYTRVMGFRLVHVRRVPYEQDRGQPPYENLRHYFFDMGNDSLLAIFEYPKGLPRQQRDHVAGMQHIAFHVPPAKFDALLERVKACRVELIGPVLLGGHVLSSGQNIMPAELYDAVLNGHPAVVWVTYHWVRLTRKDYVAFDGKTVTYAGPGEHAVTLVGVQPTRVLINNPSTGVEWIDKATFEAIYAIYDHMAVILA